MMIMGVATEVRRNSGQPQDPADIRREQQISEQICYQWRWQFGGMKADDVKRLTYLERQSATLKRLLADTELEKGALMERVHRTVYPTGKAQEDIVDTLSSNTIGHACTRGWTDYRTRERSSANT